MIQNPANPSEKDIEKMLSARFFSNPEHREKLWESLKEAERDHSGSDERPTGSSGKLISFESILGDVLKKRKTAKGSMPRTGFEELSDRDLEAVAGGVDQRKAGGWMTVTGLQSGFLAIRTQPSYDSTNEIKGAELYNGDQVQIKGRPIPGTDGRTYIMVYSPKTGTTGYANYAFLA